VQYTIKVGIGKVKKEKRTRNNGKMEGWKSGMTG
jgi:hypothetical protein